MNISITEKEYEAINAVLDQVCTDYEAASDEDYLKTMEETIDLVNNVIKKYQKARYKANTFQQVRAEVSRFNRGRCVPAKDIMIGDYIYRPDCYDKVVEVRKDTILGSDPLRGLIPITDLQPIPLTAEILKNNGFVEEGDMYRLVIHINEYNGFFMTLMKDFDGAFCVKSNRFIRFLYVHELQHAIRLCGINDKEIVL